jgi:precorrin-6A/cobalt-precorrin-6A reductase
VFPDVQRERYCPAPPLASRVGDTGAVFERRLLVLAGTTEARELVAAVSDRRTDVIVSFAGRTSSPSAMGGSLRIGGFGGIHGLTSYLRNESIDLVVDATHPFAAVMPHHAAAACRAAGVDRLRLLRPEWVPEPDDRWIVVPDLVSAAAALVSLSARRVWLTTGRQELAPFVPLADVHFVVRSIEPIEPMPLRHAEPVLDRGPFTLEAEIELVRSRSIDTLVTKNSGGSATAAKLVAARREGLAVVVVQRPPQPAGPLVTTVAAALDWLATH